MLEDGRLTDGKGQTAYFGDTILIFTSNIGASTLPAESIGYSDVRKHFTAEVEREFVQVRGRAELLGRFGQYDKNILIFDTLRPEHVASIANKFLAELSVSAKEKCQLHLSFRRCFYC